jgi:hypothetical protein
MAEVYGQMLKLIKSVSGLNRQAIDAEIKPSQTSFFLLNEENAFSLYKSMVW